VESASHIRSVLRGEQRDFFVRDPGAARREAGFHPFLARFLGWQLPDVPTYDGDLVPLYMETIFPLLFVEQKAGWSTIQGPFPTYLGIQDVGRRVVEFLLDLDAQRVRVNRHELRRRILDTLQQWRDTTATMNRAAQEMNAKLEGVPNEPTGEFALEPKVSLHIYREREWKQLREVLHAEQTALDRLTREEVPTVDEQATDLTGELETLRDQLDQTSALRDTVFEDMARARAELNALQSRLSAVETDLQKNKDALKLRNLGSILGTASESGVCPTCHQAVSEELLPPIGGQVMAIEDNIRFLEAQHNLFRAMRGNSRQRFDEREKALAALRSEISTIRARIRAVRSTLVAPSHSPSEAAIVERLNLQAWIEGHLQLEEQVSEFVQQLIDIAENFLDLKKALAGLPEKEFSATDREKIDRMRTLIQDQLSLYHFKTYPPGLVFVSPDNFRPLVRIEDTNVESELGFEMSASDGIRMKWSYLLALLKLGLERQMNHPGFLIFDEPRQQEADPVSFEALIRNASSYAKSAGQILFATSETPDDLRGAVDGLDVNLIHFEGFLLQRIG